MPLRHARDRRRGAALLVVLWLAVGAAGLVLALLETTRTAVPESRRAVDAARLRATVRAAVHLTADRLLRERLELAPEGASLAFSLDGIEARVRVWGESGLVDPAAASPGLLRALGQASGLSAERAAALAERIERWRSGSAANGAAAPAVAARGAGEVLRPPARPGLDHPIETLAAAGSGWSEAEGAALARWLAATALGTGRAEPAPELAPPPVRQAMAGAAAAAPGARPGPPTAQAETAAGRRSDPAGLYRLEIVAATPGGRRAVHAVRLALRSGELRPVRIVDWSAPLVLADLSMPAEGS